MKKLLLIITLVLSSVGLSQAQEVEKGYVGFVDVGFTTNGSKWNTYIAEVFTTHGRQFNQHIFLGGGIGLQQFIGKGSDLYSVGVPLYVDFRVNFIKHKISPFFDLKHGVSIGPFGMFTNPTLGVRFGITDKLALNLHVGYTLQSAWGTIVNQPDIVDMNHFLLHGVNVRFGFEF